MSHSVLARSVDAPAAAPWYGATTLHAPRRRRHVLVVVAFGSVLALAGVVAAVAVRTAGDDSRRDYLALGGWPAHGQAAYQLGDGPPAASPAQRPVPIASLAKVMTVYLLLRHDPLSGMQDRRLLTVSAADDVDTTARAMGDQSVVDVAPGERLSERQALIAMLLPSANNVAVMTARQLSGTVGAFVAEMNRTARRLGMRHTTYTDPSGLAAGTRSTAADQLILAGAAMRDPVFAALVATPAAPLSVAGTVHNTDVLLGRDGFVGIKTGSDDAAAGCFTFRTIRRIAGHPVALTGVVLGQPGHNLVLTGQYAAKQLADRVAPGTP